MARSDEFKRDLVVASVDALCDFQFAAIDAMRKLNMSEEELAAAIDLPVKTVKSIFSADSTVSLDTVGRILHVLKIKIRFESDHV